MMTRMMTSLAMILGLALCASAEEAAKPAPLKALLLLGGCCHDYATQKDLLEQGIEARANVAVDVVYCADTTTAPPLPFLGNPDYAKGYDVIIHDECAADVSDPAVVEGVLAPHRAGIPGVNLHCAMHCYRTTKGINKPVPPGTPESLWFDYLGIQSSGHGPQKPIAVSYIEKAHPTVTGFEDWTTINEELYNNIDVRPSATILARGVQQPNRKVGLTDCAVVWTNEFGDNKARVFSTTLGHNNETVADGRYLDLVTRGLLWACGKLQDSGVPADGYGK